nr:hypothetical protein [Escherichia coli]
MISEHEDDLRNATSYVSKQNPGFFTLITPNLPTSLPRSISSRKLSRRLAPLPHGFAKQGEFDDARQSLQEEFAQVERQLAQELKQTGMTAISRMTS